MKSEEIHAQPTRQPEGSLQARMNPQVIVSTLGISPLHAAPISRHTIEIHENHNKIHGMFKIDKKSNDDRARQRERPREPKMSPGLNETPFC